MLYVTDLQLMVAKERQADLLAYAMRQRQLAQLLPRPERKHNAWQWLRQIIQGGQHHERPLSPTSLHQPMLQG